MAVHDSRIVERWRTIIAAWRNSGLSVAAFCRSRDVNKSGFHRWRNILDERDRSIATPSRSHAQPKSSASFVPVRVIPDTVVEVILPSGVQLRVPLSADAQQLARLVLALGATPC
jgi:histidinol-phosphate/aromatic aminotransferase/cobyric acid decarboxylase-like protein